MPISAPPTIPQITDRSTFATRAQAWVVWQADELYPAIADTASILSLSTSSTSTTSNTIGTGSKSFTVETGKGYLAGQSLSIAYTTTPTNRMFAVVTSYNSGTGALVVNVQAIEGSGTYTAWSIALAFNGNVKNAQLDNQYINDLTAVTFDPATDYVAIADGSDSGNKKKAYINAIGQLNSSDAITDTGTNGKRTLTLDGVIVSEETTTARRSTIDGGSTLYPEFKCRAWVNFNGTGTVAILASGNVSSITDNGVGDYTVNFTTAMPDIDYSVLGTCRQPSGSAAVISPHNTGGANQAPTVNNFRITARAVASSPVAVDADYVMILVIR